MPIRRETRAKSEAVEEKRASVAQQVATLVTMGRDAAADWMQIRKSCIGRRIDPPGEVGIADLGSASSELANLRDRSA